MGIFLTCSFISPESEICVSREHLSCIHKVVEASKYTAVVIALENFNSPPVSWDFECHHLKGQSTSPMSCLALVLFNIPVLLIAVTACWI